MKWSYIIVSFVGGIAIGAAAYFLLKALEEKSKGTQATAIVSTLPDIEQLEKEKLKKIKGGVVISTIS